MLKNESARNPTKPTPLRPARLPDSGGIIFMSNGVRMKKISHFDRKVKQEKNVDWAGHVSVRTADVAGPYADTWQIPYGTRGSPRA
jgi:hypothetical protein